MFSGKEAYSLVRCKVCSEGRSSVSASAADDAAAAIGCDSEAHLTILLMYLAFELDL